jgi:hypothetical protein
MRNATKLKSILRKSDIDISLSDDNIFTLVTIDKKTMKDETFTGKSFSEILTKAYSKICGKKSKR